MIIRLWRTRVVPTRMGEYERFEQELSLPMFRQQAGFLGVLFLRTKKDCAALSMWEDMRAVEALATSQTYQETVHKLQATGLLVEQQALDVFEIRGGHVSSDISTLMLRKNE